MCWLHTCTSSHLCFSFRNHELVYSPSYHQSLLHNNLVPCTMYLCCRYVYPHLLPSITDWTVSGIVTLIGLLFEVWYNVLALSNSSLFSYGSNISCLRSYEMKNCLLLLAIFVKQFKQTWKSYPHYLHANSKQLCMYRHETSSLITLYFVSL